MNSQTRKILGQIIDRVKIVPDWLAPRLEKLGALWWLYMSEVDARSLWRWFAANWQRLAAWWITVGLGLTGLFLIAALITWQNPRAVLTALLTWGTSALFTSGKVAGWGALVVLVLSLPLILPAALLSLVVIVVGSMGIVVFGPLLVLGFLAFGLLVSFATLKVGVSKLLSFVMDSLGSFDQKTSLARRVRNMLGLDGSTVTLGGKARLMEGEELALYEDANRAAKRGAPIFLGTVNEKPFYVWTEKHVYVTASSRSGKGRDLIIPNLCIYPESVFVLDPKGENCRATAKRREALGSSIAAFDPYGLTGRPSARFNPLAGLQGEDMITGADYLAEALVIGPNDHWHNSARSLVRAMVLHLLTVDNEYLEKEHYTRDLCTLRAWMTGFLDLTLDTMKKSKALDGMVSRLGTSFADIPDNERGSIISTAQLGTKWLDNPKLAAMFKAGDDCISFDDFRAPAKRLSIFVCLPAYVFSTYPQVCRLLTTFALDTMMRSLTGRQRPVMFILDELAQLEHLPIVQRAFTLGAGFGAQMWAVFQSVEQARKLYPLDSLYGSAGVRCFFKIEDPESCDFASKAASGVMTPADVRHMPEFSMLTLLDGANPMIVERWGATLKKRKEAKAKA